MMRADFSFPHLTGPLLMTLMVAGCAPSVRLSTPALSLPAAFETQGAAAPDKVMLDRWWLAFDDPQLNGLIKAAQDQSTTARLAFARIVEARALRRQARATTLPSGPVTGSAAIQHGDRLWGETTNGGNFSSYQLDFSPSWEIDLFGRLGAIRDRADFDLAASTFDFYAAKLALAADVASALFDARSLAVQLADAEATLRIARELAGTARLGRERGLVSGADAARLEGDVSNAEAEVTRLAAALKTAKRSLLILVGSPDASTDSLVIEAALAQPPGVPQAAPGLLLVRRPDIRAAEMALASAARSVTIDRLALFPRIDLQPGVALSVTGGTISGGTGLWSLAAGLAFPILDRARLLAQLRVTQARGEQAVIQYERAVQNAFGEAENALTNAAAGRRRVEQLMRATAHARYAFDAARTGYRVGLTDLTTLLQSEREWRATRSALTLAQAGVLIDTVNAFRALGGGWDGEAAGAIPLQIPATFSGTP